MSYVHGHQASVLRSHSWRTVENSAAYLAPLITSSMEILDVGCGPGTITMGLAKLAAEGRVIGIEPESAQTVLEQATSVAEEAKINNVEFKCGDAHALPFADNTFDVTHAHQVLQHVKDPIQVLREMGRVTKPGGLVAVRSTDFRGLSWWPELDGLAKWRDIYLQVMRSNGSTPDTGRRLNAWAREAGFPNDEGNIVNSAGTWCFARKDEVAWWSSLWADRVLESNFRDSALKNGICTEAELEELSRTWKEWGASPDAWFLLWHGELLCRM